MKYEKYSFEITKGLTIRLPRYRYKKIWQFENYKDWIPQTLSFNSVDPSKYKKCKTLGCKNVRVRKIES